MAASSTASIRDRLQRYRATKSDAPRCESCQAILVGVTACPHCASALASPPAGPASPAGPAATDAAAPRARVLSAAAMAAEHRRRQPGEPPAPATPSQQAAARLLDRTGPLGWRVATYLKLLVWLLLGVVAVEVAVVPIFVIFSVFFGIYATTENNAHKRRAGEKSAYSVFNKNFEKLDGTFDAEQFDAELRRGRFM